MRVTVKTIARILFSIAAYILFIRIVLTQTISDRFINTALFNQLVGRDRLKIVLEDE